MKRSRLVDVFIVAAFLIGATALLGFVRGLPASCPQPSARSIEGLFAPCLALDRQEIGPGDMARLGLPPLPLAPGTTVAVAPPEPQQRPALDVDVTGSIPKGQR